MPTQNAQAAANRKRECPLRRERERDWKGAANREREVERQNERDRARKCERGSHSLSAPFCALKIKTKLSIAIDLRNVKHLIMITIEFRCCCSQQFARHLWRQGVATARAHQVESNKIVVAHIGCLFAGVTFIKLWFHSRTRAHTRTHHNTHAHTHTHTVVEQCAANKHLCHIRAVRDS